MAMLQVVADIMDDRVKHVFIIARTCGGSPAVLLHEFM